MAVLSSVVASGDHDGTAKRPLCAGRSIREIFFAALGLPPKMSVAVVAPPQRKRFFCGSVGRTAGSDRKVG